MTHKVLLYLQCKAMIFRKVEQMTWRNIPLRGKKWQDGWRVGSPRRCVVPKLNQGNTDRVCHNRMHGGAFGDAKEYLERPGTTRRVHSQCDYSAAVTR